MAPPARLVVDASVALKWLIEERERDAALDLRQHDLAAPSLLRIEVANALRTIVTRGDIPRDRAMAMLAAFQATPVVILPTDDAHERRPLEIALDLGHPVYDCVYLALAERAGRTLVTAHARFLRALRGTPFATIAEALT